MGNKLLSIIFNGRRPKMISTVTVLSDTKRCFLAAFSNSSTWLLSWNYRYCYEHPNCVACAVVLLTVEHVILVFESLLDPAFEFVLGCRIGFLGWSNWSGCGCGGWYESWADFNNRFNFSSWVTSWLNLVTSTESSILSSKQTTFRHSLKKHWKFRLA